MSQEEDICEYFGNVIHIELLKNEDSDNYDYACASCSTICPQECRYCQHE